MDTLFRTAFLLDKAPARATIRVAGFHRYSLSLNGVSLTQPLRRGRNWKEPDVFDVSRQLCAGTNRLEARVFNSNGPPALWLALQTDGNTLASSERWAASCAGAAWRPARLASKPTEIVPGCGLYGESPTFGASQAKRPLLIFAMALGAGFLFVKMRRLVNLPALAARARPLAFGMRAGELSVSLAGIHGSDESRGWLAQAKRGLEGGISERGQLVALVALVGAWVALFANNLGSLPELFGYDVAGHVDYVRYILEHKSLPLASDGWEMYQPPLYYLLCAGVLKSFGLATSQPGGIMALRLLGLVFGVAQFALAWGCLRLLFPNHSARPIWGVVFAAVLPPLLYLSQYISNEAPAAALMSASLYLALRLLKADSLPWTTCVGLGLCLGAALLTKTTAVLLLPVIFGALLWHWFEKRPLSFWQWTLRMGLILGASSVVCGWYYARVWWHFGTPIVGNWDPRSGIAWWQDDGYLTSAYFLRFGESLWRPWFSGLHSFADGIYSTLWCDGLFGGSARFAYRPPWNYGLTAPGCVLALLPACAVLGGGCLAVRRFVRQPAPEWFLMLGLGGLVSLALIYMSLKIPCYMMVKAFYGLGALVPFCAFGAWGLEAMSRRGPRAWRALVCLLFALWAFASYGSYWINRSSYSATLARANSLRESGRFREAADALRSRLRRGPENGEARSLLADTLVRAGDFQEAAREAQTVLLERPSDAGAHASLAAALTPARPGEALEHLRRAAQLAPGDAEVRQKLAGLCLAQEHVDEAIQAAREGLGIDPFRAQLRLILGTGLAARGDDAEAVTQLELAARFDTEWKEPRTLLAAIRSRMCQQRTVTRVQ
jgi:Flp pilus assembly protein TadD